MVASDLKNPTLHKILTLEHVTITSMKTDRDVGEESPEEEVVGT